MSALDDLTKWPEKAEDVNADLMIRIIGRETQVSWLKKWAEVDALRGGSEIYTGNLHAVLSGVGFMSALRELRDINAEAADELARDYWRMCDAGDSVGEVLWDLAQQSGLDLNLVEISKSDPAVDPQVGTSNV